MNVTGWITFIMQEPISGEKMWIKKLEIEPVTTQGVICTESIPQITDGGFLVGPIVSGYTRGNTLFDGRPGRFGRRLETNLSYRHVPI